MERPATSSPSLNTPPQLAISHTRGDQVAGARVRGGHGGLERGAGQRPAQLRDEPEPPAAAGRLHGARDRRLGVVADVARLAHGAHAVEQAQQLALGAAAGGAAADDLRTGAAQRQRQHCERGEGSCRPHHWRSRCLWGVYEPMRAPSRLTALMGGRLISSAQRQLISREQTITTAARLDPIDPFSEPRTRCGCQ